MHLGTKTFITLIDESEVGNMDDQSADVGASSEVDVPICVKRTARKFWQSHRALYLLDSIVYFALENKLRLARAARDIDAIAATCILFEDQIKALKVIEPLYVDIIKNSQSDLRLFSSTVKYLYEGILFYRQTHHYELPSWDDLEDLVRKSFSGTESLQPYR